MQQQMLLEQLEAALAENEQLKAELAEKDEIIAEDKRIIAQLKAERPKELPDDVFSLIMSIRAFHFREDHAIFHPPLNTGLGLRIACNKLGYMPEWTSKMKSFYDIWQSCSPEAKTHGGRKFGKMSPHNTYFFVGFSATGLGELPWFQHINLSKKFPLKDWRVVRNTDMMMQYLSNEGPRAAKPKRKRPA